MKGSLIIIGFFVLGTLCGIFHLIPVDAVMDSKVSFYALCALMFSVGLSVGNDPQTLKNFRSLNPRLVFLPIMTILGTLAGSAAVSLILTHRSLTDCLAVGSGFGAIFTKVPSVTFISTRRKVIAFLPLLWAKTPKARVSITNNKYIFFIVLSLVYNYSSFTSCPSLAFLYFSFSVFSLILR